MGAATTDEATSRVPISSWMAMEVRERKVGLVRLLLLGGGIEGSWGLHPLQQLPSDGEDAPLLSLATGVALLRSACAA